MNKDEKRTVGNSELKNGGYQVIEVNMSDSAENVYAVCTPVKMQ
ncbi:hypothetical protein [Oceanobacillus salinisoli]|nr:hypothetical protein [Oceanobacillus salinisoli]